MKLLKTTQIHQAFFSAIMKMSFILSLLLCMIVVNGQKLEYSLKTSRSIDYTQLSKGFAFPPGESRLRCYWWWLNSMATKESITRDLEEMKRNGYGGASIVDAGSSNYTVAAKTKAGPVFMTPAWMELFKFAVREAQRIGIELSVNAQSGWNPGGPTITPELALKKIVYTETKVKGGSRLEITLPQPKSNLLYTDIIVQAFREPARSLRLKDSAIKYWGIKSFNQSFGFKGTYPLNQLREEYPDTADIQKVSAKQILDLSDKFKNGVLIWEVPEGEWTIIRYGWTCTGAVTSTNSDGWSGLSVDHLSRDAFNKFSADVIVPLIKTAQEVGTSLHFLQTDSWEMGNVGWTQNFPSEFKKFRRYDMMSYLPVLAGRVVESIEQSDRFLHDYRLTIGDCVAANHYQLFSNLAHRFGLGFHPESGGPHSAPVDALRVMAINDFPQGEFWATANTHRIKDDERLAVKQSACVAHTNGKRYVAAEGPTSIGPQWERAPRDLKANIDRVFCSGVNRIVWHTFTSSPREFGLPGNEYFAGTHLNPNVTWWKQSKDFISYLNRSSYMLSQGLFSADVLYYYGDDVPNFVFLKEDVKNLRFGYDWDKCSKDAISKLSVKDGKAVFPDGMTYRLLVLPSEAAINIDVLRKVEGLVKAGLTVIGLRPTKSTGLTNYPEYDSEITAIASRLWGDINGSTKKENKYGKGKVIWGKDVTTVLEEMKVSPDFSFTSPQPATALDYIHRTGNGMEIYFLSNRFARVGTNDFAYHYEPLDPPNRYEQVECSFRVSGMVPELWDPITGEIKKISIFREEGGRTVIPLFFEPEGSKFIVFRKATVLPHIVKIEKNGERFFPGNRIAVQDHAFINVEWKDGKQWISFSEPGNYTLQWSDGKNTTYNLPGASNSIDLTGAWNVSFDTTWNAPAMVRFDSLYSWTASKIEGVKYYSGTAVYEKAFSVDDRSLAGTRVVLDLGNVLEMAAIKINNHPMQVRWCAPFRFDITDYVKPGNNNIKVEITNLWPNRLIGDSKLPKEQRLTKTNVMKFDEPNSETLLRPSGLLGPVKIKFLHNKVAR